VERMEALLKMVSTFLFLIPALDASYWFQFSVWHGLMIFSMQLRPEIDLDAQLGPPIIRDSWKTEHQTASPASASSNVKISPVKSSFKHSVSHMAAQSIASIPLPARLPPQLYPDRKDHSRSSSNSSSVVVALASNVSPDCRRSPSTGGSQESWSDLDESDDDSSPLSAGARRLTMGPMESTGSRDVSMESPLMFVGKSSSYGLSCRVRKMKAGYMDEVVRVGVEREIGDDAGDLIPKYIRPHRRMQFWTTPSVSIINLFMRLRPRIRLL
jgi:hypothetical protein